MKKVLAIVLALTMVLTLGVTAFAADVTADKGTANTDLTLTVGATFTVTIPETITLTAGDNGVYTGTGTVSAEYSYFDSAKDIKVSTAASVEMKNDAQDAITATLTNNEYTFETAATQNGVANTANYTVTATATPQYAGTYTGTATFTVAVVDKVSE